MPSQWFVSSESPTVWSTCTLNLSCIELYFNDCIPLYCTALHCIVMWVGEGASPRSSEELIPAWSLGCTKMHESQKVMGADSQNKLLYQTKSLQKELGFFLQNCGGAQFLKFLVKIGGKRRKNDRKYAIFQNSFHARPKMLNA